MKENTTGLIKDQNNFTVSDTHYINFLELDGTFSASFYNCRFNGLHLHNAANNLAFINCNFSFGNVVIEDGVTVNISGGALEGCDGIGIIITASNIVNIEKVYFEHNILGDVLVDSGYNSAINIKGCYFNSQDFRRKSIQVNGMSRPNVENNYFASKTAYNLIDVRCRTKNNSFDSILKKVINL